MKTYPALLVALVATLPLVASRGADNETKRLPQNDEKPQAIALQADPPGRKPLDQLQAEDVYGALRRLLADPRTAKPTVEELNRVAILLDAEAVKVNPADVTWDKASKTITWSVRTRPGQTLSPDQIVLLKSLLEQAVVQRDNGILLDGQTLVKYVVVPAMMGEKSLPVTPPAVAPPVVAAAPAWSSGCDCCPVPVWNPCGCEGSGLVVPVPHFQPIWTAPPCGCLPGLVQSAPTTPAMVTRAPVAETPRLVSLGRTASAREPVEVPLPEGWEGLAADELYDRGLQAYDRGDFRQALAHLRAAVRKNPEDARTWYFTALAEIQMNDPHAAESARRAADLEQRGLPRSRDIGLALERVQGPVRRQLQLLASSPAPQPPAEEPAAIVRR